MNLLIFKNGTINITETFIVSNVNKLPHDITVLSLDHNGIPVANHNNPDRLTVVLFYLQKVCSRIFKSDSTFFKQILFSRYLKKHKIDVVLAQFGHSGAEIYEGCRRLNIPLVVYLRGFDVTKDKMLQKYSNEYLQMFKYSAATISVSRSIRKQIISLGAEPDIAFVAPSGADIKLFKSEDQLNNNKQLLFVGRLVEKKAPHLLIQTFSKVLERHPTANLTMVGDGPLLNVCKDLIQVLKLQDSIDLVGFKNHNEIVTYMKKSFIYVQHSVVAHDGDSEGTPVSILEAGASGLPVVATHHAGISDAIIHGQTGYLVNERDIDSMAKYINCLLDDPELARKMGCKAKSHIRENFSQSETINRVGKIINWVNDDCCKKPSLYPEWNHLLEIK